MASISICLSAAKSRHFSLSKNLTITPPTIIKQPPFHLHLPSSNSRFSPLKDRDFRVSRVRVIKAASGINVPSSLKPGKVVESDKLPTDVRKRTMEAIDSFRRRVTIGDVASKAGLQLNEAEKALQALASDADGFLEVSDEGDVLYVFPKDYRSKLLGKSLRMKLEPWAEQAKSAAEYLIRVSFGTTLIASIILVFTTILVLMASAESDGDSRKRRGSSSSSKIYNSVFSFSTYPTDLFWYWDRDYYRRSRTRGNREGMNFLESVFSFVFGDGDPNQGIEEERWKLIGQYITSNGGVVAAEELAPYLDVHSKKESDDSYILPVLLRFDGQPGIDDQGNILYRFPSLQRTASSTDTRRKEYIRTVWSNWDEKVPKFFKEEKLEFSKTSLAERAMVIGLGALNLSGVIVLSTLLKNMSTIPNGLVSFVATFLPVLQVYAGSFFAIPLLRWFSILKTNTEIEKRNQARQLWARALELPDMSLKRKILGARDMAQRTVIGKDRIVYSTDKDFDEQDYEGREWEARFRELERSD